MGKTIKKNNVKYLNILFLLAGILLFVYMLRGVGVSSLWVKAKEMGFNILWVFAVHPFTMFFQALSWYLSVSEGRTAKLFKLMYISQIISWSVGEIIPGSGLAAEAYKGYALKDKMDNTKLLSSLVIHNTIHALTTLSMIALGTVALFFVIKVSLSAKLILVSSVSIGLLFFVFLISRQKKGMFVSILSFLMKIRFLKKHLSSSLDKARDVDTKMAWFWKNEKKAFLLSFISMWIVKITGALELYLIMQFINYPISAWFSVILFILSNIMMIALFFIPSQVGVATGGFSLAFKSLGYSAKYGILLGVFRRIKCVFWAGAGLIFIPLLGASSQKAVSKDEPPEDDLAEDAA